MKLFKLILTAFAALLAIAKGVYDVIKSVNDMRTATAAA